MLKDILLQLQPEFYRPTLARLIVTHNCPLKCQMCSFWHEWKQDPTTEDLKAWIKELVDFGVEDISLGGGEPFIRKDLTELVEEIHSYGITCGVTTSGWIEKDPFPPVDRVEVSIDGAKPETHDKIRGMEGSWEKAVGLVKRLKEMGKINQINFVLQRDNYLELEEYTKMAKSLGVKASIIPISLDLVAQPRLDGGLAEIDPVLLRDQIEKAYAVGNVATSREFIEFWLAKANQEETRTRCLAPNVEILVFATGDVYPCGNIQKPVGNLREASLENIYRGYRERRKEIREGSYSACDECIYPDIIFARGFWQNTERLFKRVLP
ncbi:radical SAM protein [Candidatus Bathyarchaeota archaeon]|nr:radical SAM protein [Candidatus Bathyarchaeota archaeon]